jgi:hypothetical protein
MITGYIRIRTAKQHPDIMNETGMVTLNGGDVEYTQRIVTDTNNKLAAPILFYMQYGNLIKLCLERSAQWN